MKKLLILLILLLTAAPALAVTNIEAAAKITDVTVYNDRALTKRSATVQLKPGLNLVTIKNLPLLLQDDSLTIEGSGEAKVMISGVLLRRQFLEQAMQPKQLELQSKIKKLEQELTMLEAGKSGNAAQKDFVGSLKNSWTEWLVKKPAGGAVPASALQEMMTFIGNNITKLEQDSYHIETAQQKLRDSIDALKRELAAAGNGRKENKQVELALETENGGSFTLQLAAVTSKAGWKPVYDLHLNTDGKNALLTYRAQVHQQTGEDWENVSLKLSTAKPSVGGAPPVLYPWHISLARPIRAVTMAASAPLMARKALPFEESDGLAAENIAAFQAAEVEQELTSTSFNIGKPTSVNADGTGYGTVIAVNNLPVQTAYQVIPKLAQTAWLTAEMVNNSGYPLLPGEIRIFTDNSFIGSAMMKKTAVDEKMTLPFGADDQLLVKYESKKEHQAAGFFGNNRMLYRNKITVENLRDRAVVVAVKDQLPLAENKEIKVSLENSSIKPGQIKEDGTIIWELALQAGEKQEINFGVMVEYPEGQDVIGL